MAVKLGTQIALGAALGLGLMFAGCGSSADSGDSDTNPQTSSTIPVVGNYPGAGGAGQSAGSSNTGSFFKGWPSAAAGSSGSAGAAGSSGASASAGHAGSAAGSGGSAGMAAAGSSGAAGSNAAAGSGGSQDDPLDLFGLGGGAPSCDGKICVDDKDCGDLYPAETAACKFTKCVDLICQ